MSVLTNDAIRIFAQTEETPTGEAIDQIVSAFPETVSLFPMGALEIHNIILQLQDFVEDFPYCAVEDGEGPDEEDCQQVTIGFRCDNLASYGFQTGDNSFTGNAYGFPEWAVTEFIAPRDLTEIPDIVATVAEDLLDQMEERICERKSLLA